MGDASFIGGREVGYLRGVEQGGKARGLNKPVPVVEGSDSERGADRKIEERKRDLYMYMYALTDI